MNATETEAKASGLFGKELEIIRTLTPPSVEEIHSRQIFLGPKTKRWTLVLDLDQTLVWVSPIAATGQETNLGKEYVLTVRPYAEDLIQSLSSKFEIIIFTSSEEDYARQVFDFFNSNGNYIAKLLTKPSCVATKQGYIVKDLRIFADRSPREMLIVDDYVVSFAFNLANGVPVTPYEGDPNDSELYHLKAYLEKIADSDDIIKANQQFIGLARVGSGI